MKNKKSNHIHFANTWIIFISLATFFIGIGYAKLSSTTLSIGGLASSSEMAELYIDIATYKSNTDADLDNSSVDTIYQTTMSGVVTLSDTNASSSITYEVTINNDSSVPYIYKETTYSTTFYDNESIVYAIDGLTEDGTVVDGVTRTGTIIPAGGSVTFTITFAYEDDVTVSEDINTLNYTM